MCVSICCIALAACEHVLDLSLAYVKEREAFGRPISKFQVTQHKLAKMATKVLASVAVVQVGLGISTLLLVVPVPLAALHQTGALVLLCIAVWLAHEFRFPDPKH